MMIIVWMADNTAITQVPTSKPNFPSPQLNPTANPMPNDITSARSSHIDAAAPSNL
jgi:hypothetical protein